MSKQMIRVDDIIIDPRCQQREIDKDNVDRLVSVLDDGGQFNDPIEVFTDGDSTWLAHGFHRTRAYVAAGFKTCHAIVHKGTIEDAIDFSCKPLNAAHGRPETRADRERRVKLMIDRHYPEWSANKIAKHCGVSNSTVSIYCKDVCESQTSGATVTDSLGRQQPATKPRKPKRDPDESYIDVGNGERLYADELELIQANGVDVYLHEPTLRTFGLDDARWVCPDPDDGEEPQPQTTTEVIDGDTGEVIENPVTVKTTTPKPPSVTVPTVTGEMLYLDADTDAAAQAITDEMGREYASRLANSLTALLKG